MNMLYGDRPLPATVAVVRDDPRWSEHVHVHVHCRLWADQSTDNGQKLSILWQEVGGVYRVAAKSQS